MGWWITLFVLIGLAILPLGVSLRYQEDGVLLRLIAGPIRLTLLPRKKKRNTEKQDKKDPAEKAESQAASQQKKSAKPKNGEKKGGSLKDFLPLVRVALDFLGAFRRKLRVDVLELKLILAGDDPADLAINYGRAWAALGNLWPRLEELFVIKKRDVQVECDFTSDKTLVLARLDLTITLGRMIGLLVWYGIRALKEYFRIKNQNKGGAAV